MAVAFDAVSPAYSTLTTSVTVALTVANNARVCLVATVQLRGAVGLSVSAIYANGVQMTQLARVEAAGTDIISNQIFALTAAPTGVVSVSANVVGGTQRGMGIIVASYTGNRSSRPFSAIAVVSAGNVTSTHLSVSTSTTHRCVLFGCGTNSLDSNTTVRAAAGDNWGVYLGDTAGTLNSTGAFSASLSQSVGPSGYIHASILLNISSFLSGVPICVWNRAVRDVGF